MKIRKVKTALWVSVIALLPLQSFADCSTKYDKSVQFRNTTFGTATGAAVASGLAMFSSAALAGPFGVSILAMVIAGNSPDYEYMRDLLIEAKDNPGTKIIELGNALRANNIEISDDALRILLNKADNLEKLCLNGRLMNYRETYTVIANGTLYKSIQDSERYEANRYEENRMEAPTSYDDINSAE